MDSVRTSLSDEFAKLLESFVVNLNLGKYTSTDSLKNIVEILTPLLSDFRYPITEITNRIKGFGYSKSLTQKQIKSLCSLMSELLTGIKSGATNLKEVINTNKRKRNINLSQNIPSTPFIRLNDKEDSVISEIVLGLIINLSRNVMSSTLNIYVKEYFDTVSLVVGENLARYTGFVNEIEQCLIKYGWNHSLGFIKEPKSKDIITSLQTILDKYFMTITNKELVQPKFNDEDAVLSQIVFNLIINLSRDVMSSTLNTYVTEYFDDVEPIINDYPTKYGAFSCQIESCLIKHGWNHSSGFSREPNPQKIINDLQTILDRYF